MSGAMLMRRRMYVRPAFSYILPDDTDRFPATLNGFAVEEVSTERNWGSSSTYKGSVYAKPALSNEAVKLGRAYSNFGNYVTSFEEYRQGDIAVGYSADRDKTTALNIWYANAKPSSISAFRSWLNANPITVLYELYEDDGSVWRAARQEETNGYFNSQTDTFVPVFGMIGHDI